ncbi:MAG: STAS domain-containing protein [Leptospira sp.]|nr:STAS domain-containing protein [Leptospira sp.]
MEIKKTESDNSVDISLVGEFTIYSVSELKNDFNKLFQKDRTQLTLNLDLSQVTRIDTAAIQLLIALKLEFLRNHFSVNFINHSEAVIEAIELYGLMGFFGDPIRLNKSQKETFLFAYGRKKGFY